MNGVRAIDLREHARGIGRLRASFFPPYADWMCGACRIGLHENCMGEIKVCFCPVCWMQEDEEEDGSGPLAQTSAFDSNLTSGIRLW